MMNRTRYFWITLACLALVTVGCNRVSSRSDSQIASDVQSKIFSDGNVPDKQITINANNGVVTLSGTVSGDAVRTAAAGDAGQIQGVKTVVNNLEVGSTTAANVPPPQQESAPPQAQPVPPPSQEPSRTSAGYRKFKANPRSNASDNTNDNTGDSGLRTTVPPQNNNVADNTPPPVQAAPTPLPPPQKVTIPTGTQLSIRVNEEVNSEKAQVGDTFHGSISAPVTIDDQVVIPTTADVEGRVVDVKSAGRFAGGSVLTLQLTKLIMNGKLYSIQTDQWSKSGNGKGKGTAAKVGGGAAVGAILGGIFGGGKGAAIGTVAGAGAGTAGSAVGKGQQIILKPEAVINFSLQNSLTVTPGVSRQAMQ